MKVLISYVSTHKQQLIKFWDKNRSNAGNRLGSNIIKPKKQGGSLELIDFFTKKVVLSKNMETPMAVFFDNKLMKILCSNALNELIVLDTSLNVLDNIKLSLFNSIHSISTFYDDYIFSSTGIDALIGFNFKKKKANLLWKASDDNYDYFPDGSRRIINYTENHSLVTYPTLQQATHINSGVVFNEGKNILSTLFHQGLLININLKNKKTKIVLDNLHAPHGAHVYFNGGIELGICSDTKNNVVYIDIPLNNKIKTKPRILNDNFKWVQNAKYFIEERKIFVLDSNNSRIAVYDYDNLELIDEYRFSRDKRIFDICKI